MAFSQTFTARSSILADSQGFFKKHGLDVAIKVYESGPVAVNDLIADKIDITAPAEFVFVLQSFKHPDLRVPATICVASDHDLIVRKDRGIARPQDLKGKRVAVTRGSSGEFFLYNYLIFNRIPAESVRVVYQTPYEMVKAMADGTIDAALSWPPLYHSDGATTGREGCPLARPERTGVLYGASREGRVLEKAAENDGVHFLPPFWRQKDLSRNIPTGRRPSCARG